MNLEKYTGKNELNKSVGWGSLWDTLRYWPTEPVWKDKALASLQIQAALHMLFQIIPSFPAGPAFPIVVSAGLREVSASASVPGLVLRAHISR